MAGLIWILFVALGFIALVTLIASVRHVRPILAALDKALRTPSPAMSLRLTTREINLAKEEAGHTFDGQPHRSKPVVHCMETPFAPACFNRS